jgi:hypothetical protein
MVEIGDEITISANGTATIRERKKPLTLTDRPEP